MNETQNTNDRLKSAVNSVAVPPYLEARIRNRIQTEQRPRPWFARPAFFKMLTAGVAAIICLGVAIAYQQGHFRFSRGSQRSYIASISTRLVSIMRPGLADHIFCSVYRKYPKDAPAVDVLAKKLPPQFHELIPIVQAQVPSDYRLLISHQCRIDGRRFVHLSLENDSHVLSLVITKRNGGESFKADGLLPVLMQSDIPMYQSGAARFTMTAFETRDYLVYFVSDLPQTQNTQIMRAMAPALKDLFKKLEG